MRRYDSHGLLWSFAFLLSCSGSSSSRDARSADAVNFPDSHGNASTGADGDTGPDGATASNNADASTPLAEATRVCRAAIKAQIERANFCFAYDVDYAKYLDACPDYYFGADSNRSVADVAACLPLLETVPCSELALNITHVCLAGGKRPTGAGCSFPSQCQSNSCSAAATGCGHCGDGNFPPGATCERFQCQPGDYCDESIDKCVSKSTFVYASQGENCLNSKTSTVICKGDLQCKDRNGLLPMACQDLRPLNCLKRQCDAGWYCSDRGTGTCTAYAKLDEACSDVGMDGLPLCGPSLRCWMNKCTPRRLAGESCTPEQPCSEYYDCVNGTCRLRDCPA